MKYQTKPVTVEAIQLWASTRQKIKDWSGDDGWFYESNGDDEMYIYTAQGGTCAKAGDFIVKDENGQFSICDPKEFEAKYEPVP